MKCVNMDKKGYDVSKSLECVNTNFKSQPRLDKNGPFQNGRCPERRTWFIIQKNL